MRVGGAGHVTQAHTLKGFNGCGLKQEVTHSVVGLVGAQQFQRVKANNLEEAAPNAVLAGHRWSRAESGVRDVGHRPVQGSAVAVATGLLRNPRPLRSALCKSQGNWIPSCFSSWVRSCCTCVHPQHVPRGQHSLPDRLHTRNAIQNVMLPHNRGSSPLFIFPKPLSGCCLPCEKCLSSAEPLCTAARHLLHAASVCCSSPCYPPHHSGPAQRHASCHVCTSHPPSPCQRCGHGNGRGHHNGHVSRDIVDNPLPNTSGPPPRHDAHIPAAWNANLQLRASAVVKFDRDGNNRYAFICSPVS
ncbi:myelin-associated neurite-outgrowth inhibitor [Arapaima gigas]